MDGSVASARDKIDEIGQQIQTKQLIKKQCSAYRASREIVENEKNTQNPALYRGQHQKEYELHNQQRGPEGARRKGSAKAGETGRTD